MFISGNSDICVEPSCILSMSLNGMIVLDDWKRKYGRLNESFCSTVSMSENSNVAEMYNHTYCSDATLVFLASYLGV